MLMLRVHGGVARPAIGKTMERSDRELVPIIWMNLMNRRKTLTQKTGIAAIISIIAAAGSYYMSLTGSPIIGFILALVSVPLGILGLVLAASPRVSGGLMSIAAIALGGFGMIVAVMAMVGLILL
jgi:hypothetical protein